MIVDDAILLFRSATEELENPHQMIFCILMHVCGFMIKDGMIVYITGDRKETTFFTN